MQSRSIIRPSAVFRKASLQQNISKSCVLGKIQNAGYVVFLRCRVIWRERLLSFVQCCTAHFNGAFLLTIVWKFSGKSHGGICLQHRWQWCVSVIFYLLFDTIFVLLKCLGSFLYMSKQWVKQFHWFEAEFVTCFNSTLPSN